MVSKTKNTKKSTGSKTSSKMDVKKDVNMKEKKKISDAMAVGALFLNISLLPGLGSIIAGRNTEGVWQLVLFLIGIPLIFAFLIGIPVMIIAWIWALVTSVDLLKETM